ncbi:MAG: glycoside hydrolase family 3 protein [Gemmatimonadaceae bacterium]|nr:glycoside hydrolase family 3 protein [Gemmatimonadaceae bacterium]
MTLREKAAQMVWPTVLGDYTSLDSPQWQRVRREITEDKVGGYTVSVGSPTEIAAKLNAMQRLIEVPLLIGADLEFGAGYRARGGYFVPNAIDLGGAVLFPTQMALGATRDTALAYEQGRVTAIEGRALGIHIAYAPILDVNSNPANPVINVRSYGEDPHLDGRLGASFIRGLQEHGMLATGKHFPGHGDTEVNSHLALPVITVSRARLDSLELTPFRAAIAAGVGAMMSFHGVMPALDSTGVPGTLSREVLTDLLREEMGFGGVIISDAMDMRGVLDQFGAEEATKRAVAAGADVLIQPLDVRATIDAIVEGVAENRYTEARIDATVRRLLALKQRMGLDRNRAVALDSVRAVVGGSANFAVAREIADRSIVLLKDSGRQLLRNPTPGMRVLSITVARRADLAAGAAFNAELRRVYPRLRTIFVPADDISGSLARLEAATDSADVTIIGSYVGQGWDAVTVGAPQPFVDFVQRSSARGRDPIVVAFGNPYLLSQIPSVPTYLIAWSGAPVSQIAAARALLVEIPITGRLPITIGSLTPGSAIIKRPPRNR